MILRSNSQFDSFKVIDVIHATYSTSTELESMKQLGYK